MFCAVSALVLLCQTRVANSGHYSPGAPGLTWGRRVIAPRTVSGTGVLLNIVMTEEARVLEPPYRSEYMENNELK